MDDEVISTEERHKRYLKYLGIDEDTYQEFFKELGVNVEDPYPGIYLGNIILPNKDSEIRLNLNTVRNMGMEIDPVFLLELRVNGIVPEFVFRLARKGEVPDRYLIDSFMGMRPQ